MAIVVTLLVVVLVLLVFLLGLSVAVAFLLHWLLPAVPLEMALLVSVIAVGQVMLMAGRIFSTMPGSDTQAEDEPVRPIVILDRDIALPRQRRKRS